MLIWDRMRLKYRSSLIKNSTLNTGSNRGRDSFMGDIMSRISGMNIHTLYAITAMYIITEKFDNHKFSIYIIFFNIYIIKIKNFYYSDGKAICDLSLL